MELRDYLRVARRQWWILAVSVLIALGVAMVLTSRTRPVYASTVTFFVNTSGGEGSSALEGSMFVQGRLKTYSELLTGDRMAKALAAGANTGLTPEQIKARITVATEGDSVLVVVTVTDGVPERAQQLCEALAGQFQELVKALETRPGDKIAPVSVEPLEPPRLQDAPIEPRPVHDATLGVAVGLILGTALAVIREIADTSVRSASALRDLAGVPVLARIPVDRKARRRSGPFVSDSRSPRAEALRQLRTNVEFADREHPVKTLTVTSATGGEGRSATACGLAILFAEAGRRVVIVDAELRRPRLAAFLGRDSSAGLSSVLAGHTPLDQALQQWGSGLWLLGSGDQPPNPSELLGSTKMDDLLDELRGRFDMVILDSPPLLPVTDGAVVAARTDGAILLVRSRKTTTKQVTAAVRALRQVDARLLGCVLNMVAAKHTGPWLLLRRPVAGSTWWPGRTDPHRALIHA